MLGILLAAAAAAAPRLAVLPLAHGEGVPDSTTAALTESLAAEVRRASGAEVITKREIESVLSLELQKQMLGCQTDACVAELGGALGVEQLVTGDVARLGESWLVHLKVVRPANARVVAQADRRIRGGTVDDVLDQLPAMVAELFPGGPGPRAPAAAATPATTAVPAAVAPPALRLDEPADPGDARAGLLAYADGQGHVIAVLPFSGTEGPLYAGDGKALYQARLVGGGREGTVAYDQVFWDPRFPRGAERLFQVRDGKATLTCGAREIPLSLVAPREARKLVATAAFRLPPWRRVPHALARDGDGVHYLLDGARGADGRALEGVGWTLWIGRKGAMVPVKVEEVGVDGAGLLARTAAGTLEVGRDEKGRWATWRTPAGKAPLVWLEPGDHGPLLYRELSPYAGQPLGTPCDPYVR